MATASVDSKLDEGFSYEVMQAEDWSFSYDGSQSPMVSSGRKVGLVGWFSDCSAPSRGKVEALLFFYSPNHVENFGCEVQAMSAAQTVGVGPKILKIGQCMFREVKNVSGLADGLKLDSGVFDLRRMVPFVVEEYVGESLEALVLPEGCPARQHLHQPGTRERELENRKIEFDIAWQVMNLHDRGMYHRDIRLANVCVRRFGDKPADIRATLIDFDISTDRKTKQLPAKAVPYFECLFEDREDVLPREIDLGFLTELFYEIDHSGARPFEKTGEHYVKTEAFSQERWSFFSIDEAGRVWARALSKEDDLNPMSEGLGLSRCEDVARVFGSEQAAQTALEKVQHGGYFDNLDLRTLERDVEMILLSKREELARASYARGHALTDGYASWDDQPELYKQSGLAKAGNIMRKIESVGCHLEIGTGDNEGVVESFSDDQVEILAKMEHARYCVERMRAGFKPGEADDPEHKVKRALLPWDELDDEKEIDKKYKDYDRKYIRELPIDLASAGLVVCAN